MSRPVAKINPDDRHKVNDKIMDCVTSIICSNCAIQNESICENECNLDDSVNLIESVVIQTLEDME